MSKTFASYTNQNICIRQYCVTIAVYHASSDLQNFRTRHNEVYATYVKCTELRYLFPSNIFCTCSIEPVEIYIF